MYYRDKHVYSLVDIVTHESSRDNLYDKNENQFKFEIFHLFQSIGWYKKKWNVHTLNFSKQ
jgi:hypothetical protein